MLQLLLSVLGCCCFCWGVFFYSFFFFFFFFFLSINILSSTFLYSKLISSGYNYAGSLFTSLEQKIAGSLLLGYFFFFFFLTGAGFVVTSLIRTEWRKMEAITVVLSRLSNVDSSQTGPKTRVKNTHTHTKNNKQQYQQRNKNHCCVPILVVLGGGVEVYS